MRNVGHGAGVSQSGGAAIRNLEVLMPSRSVRRGLPALLLIAAATLSCGGGGSTAPTEEPGVVTIHLTANNRFSPADVTIDPGTTVRWVNDAVMLHTVTPNNPSQPGVWAEATTSSTGLVMTHTFSQSGQTYSYHCQPHLAEGMTGVVRVR